ncbi:MAG: 6-hydroxycyclohex-1-ene-1-carbonyl-CoA dehydrogenase [Polyangia bacterium]|jgi:6-hydroxycyclohex-1-ene-1-carbonyl-CoA dehydrogenase|nr:6-hydroxycyclohex-1-ene-1-carbonyl-CoA dehydrogenase [Polyangia bacterium]
MTHHGEREITGWVMTEPGKPFEKQTLSIPAPAAGEVLVEVAGCGVCHTDISFLHLGVKTRKAPPLILGHEIAGRVIEVGQGGDADPAAIAAAKALEGKPVLVPAVLPCGICELCRAGHRTICRAQIMPGNDRHGGFASHVVVPARYVCPVPDAVLAKNELWELSIVSDAMTTPFMSVKRSGLAAGDLAIVIGAGGVGIHAVQIAAATGAKVIALDVDDAKLEQAKSSGAGAVINVRGLDPKALKGKMAEAGKAMGAPKFCTKIFETSGTKAGQDTGFGLLTFGSYMAVVGFTMDKLDLRLSNLMAFDATVRGNWGCDPELYPEVLDWIGSGRLKVKPYVEGHPLEEANAVFDAAHHGKLVRRAVLKP